ALAKSRGSADLQALAALFKRVKNITKDFHHTRGIRAVADKFSEPAEIALNEEIERRWPAIDAALSRDRYADAMREIVALRGPVDRFFVDVLVMADDSAVREARLTLLSALKDMILRFADISEIVPDEKQA